MNIGDKISVVDEDLKGIITSINSDSIAFEDEFGFSHQYPKSKLVLHHSEIYENIKMQDKYEYTKPKSKKHSTNHLVLDLHFDKLVSHPNDYNSFERLFIQKEKLIDSLDFCRENRIKRLEIIHGIGDGTLQKMVHNTLQSQVGIDFYNKDILHHQTGAVIVEFHHSI